MAKIAVLSFYTGVVERGVETFALEISRRLSKIHKITVFQIGNPKIEDFKSIQVKVKSSIPKAQKGLFGKVYLDIQSLKILIFTIKILKILYKEKYDVILPLNGGWQTAIVRVFSKFTHSKVLISGHAGIGSDDAWNLLFRPDIFVALTQSEANWARKLTPEQNIEVIPNGVDLNSFNPKVVPKKLNLQSPIVICVSALVPYKRIDLTIKAVAKAKNTSLLIVGDGELRGQIDALGKRLLGKRYLRITAAYSEMPSYYKAAKVFSIASKTEAFGISYVEAMACNLPVVTTNDQSRVEIVGKAGILTNPENLGKYSQDLKLALNTNYKNVPYDQSLKFSWNKTAQKYNQLMSKLTT